MTSLYCITTECLRRLDFCDLASVHKELIKEKIMEIQGLLEDNPHSAMKCEFFAREHFENLLMDIDLLLKIQAVGNGPLTKTDIGSVIGGATHILTLIKET